MDINIFLNLAKIFSDNGYSLYMIGGTSRDYLLGIESADYDFVTDATPSETKTFLKDTINTFEKYGVLGYKVNGIHVDIVTLRKESNYLDSRHPKKIEFIKDLSIDYLRRDFTINAIYIDKDLKVIDFANGVEDLKNKIIRFIGDPLTRIKEDPLRILRAYRFQKKLGFKIEEETLKLMQEHEYLLENLNKDKIKEEERKANK